MSSEIKNSLGKRERNPLRLPALYLNDFTVKSLNDGNKKFKSKIAREFHGSKGKAGELCYYQWVWMYLKLGKRDISLARQSCSLTSPMTGMFMPQITFCVYSLRGSGNVSFCRSVFVDQRIGASKQTKWIRRCYFTAQWKHAANEFSLFWRFDFS